MNEWWEYIVLLDWKIYTMDDIDNFSSTFCCDFKVLWKDMVYLGFIMHKMHGAYFMNKVLVQLAKQLPF